MANLYDFGSDRFYFRPDRNIDLYNLNAVRNDHLAKGIKFCLVNKSTGETNTDNTIKADMAIAIKGERALVVGENETIENPETGVMEVWHVIQYTKTSLQHAGDAQAQIIFSQGEKTLHSFAFDFKIHEDLLTQGMDMGEVSFDLSNLKEVIVQVNEVKAQYEEASQDIAAMREAETERQSAETERIRKETERLSAETTRLEAETARDQAEAARQSAEAERIRKETERLSAEEVRIAAEAQRNEKEEERLSKETERQSAEAERIRKEEERLSKETERQSKEAARAAAEAERVTAEEGRIAAESGRVTAESGRVTAEQNRETAFQNLLDNLSDNPVGNLAADLENVKTDVTTLQTGKADKAEVEAGLANKADKTEFEAVKTNYIRDIQVEGYNLKYSNSTGTVTRALPKGFSGAYEDLTGAPDLTRYQQKEEGKGLSTNDFTDEKDRTLTELSEVLSYSMENQDENGNYKKNTFTRENGTKYAVGEFQGGYPYPTYLLTLYEQNGTTVKTSLSFNLTWDEENNRVTKAVRA